MSVGRDSHRERDSVSPDPSALTEEGTPTGVDAAEWNLPMLEFNESDSDPEDDEGGLGGSLTLAEMDLLFTDEDRALFQRIENQIEQEHEAWLDENLANEDPDKVVGLLAARQSQSWTFLNRLRKNRFIALGGKKKSRSLLMRYGITHTKLIREACRGGLDIPQTYPRNAAQALLKRLRRPAHSPSTTALVHVPNGASQGRSRNPSSNETPPADKGNDARFDHLRRAFQYCIEQQRNEFELAKFELVNNDGGSFEAGGGPSGVVGDSARHDLLSDEEAEAPSSLTSPTTSKVVTPRTGTDTASGEGAKARAMPREARQHRRKKLKKPPIGLDEKHFVRGMSRFFTILIQSDTTGPALTITKRAAGGGRRKNPEDVSVIFEENPAEIREMARESAAWTSVEKRLSEDTLSDTEGDELQSHGAVHKALYCNTDPHGLAVEPDFLELGGEAIAVGFRAMFSVIDVNDRGWISFEELKTFILESSVLSQDNAAAAARKEFEFLYSAHSACTVDCADAMYVKSRDLLLMGGTDISLVGPEPSFPRKGIIITPTDPFTLAPLYRVSVVEYLASSKTVVAGFTDGFVRFFASSSLQRPKVLAQVRLDSTPLSMLVLHEVVYCGTRTGRLAAVVLRYRDKGYTATIRSESSPHTDAVSRVAPVTSENALLTCSLDGGMALHDTKSLKEIFRFPKFHTQGIRDVFFMAWQNLVISVGFDGLIYVWSINLIHQSPIAALDHVAPHSTALCSVCGVDQLAMFLTMDDRGMVKVWDAQNVTCLQTIHLSHFNVGDSNMKALRMFVRSELPSSSFPLGLIQMYCLSKYRLYVLEYNTSQRPVILRNTADDDPVLYVGYCYSEAAYLTVTCKNARVWNAASSSIRDSFRFWEAEEYAWITAAAMSNNGKSYFLGCGNGTVVVKSLTTGSTLHQSTVSHLSEVTAMIFAPSAAGYGDVLFSMSQDSVTLHSVDFTTLFRLPNILSPRCIEYDTQSACLLVGDVQGFASAYLLAEITPGSCEPHAVLQFPKRDSLRPICCLAMLHGLSSFVAADEEGQLALFSLRHHPRPFTCIAVWNHVGDTQQLVPIISAMFFSTTLFCLYCGDEMGIMTMYSLKEAIARGQSAASAVGAAAAKSSSHLARRDKSSSSTEKHSRHHEGSLAAKVAAVAHFSGATFHPHGGGSKHRTKHVVNLLVDVPPVDIGFAAVGATIAVVNRWLAHEELVSSIFQIQPTPEAESAMEKHCVLLTASLDQCCYSWTNAGCRHLGALEQYGRCRVPLSTFESTNDLPTVESSRPTQLLQAKRDMVKLRVKGLVRRANTATFTIVPPWIAAVAEKAATEVAAGDAVSADNSQTRNNVRRFLVTVPPESKLLSQLEFHEVVSTRKRVLACDHDVLSISSESSFRDTEHHVQWQKDTNTPLQVSRKMDNKDRSFVHKCTDLFPSGAGVPRQLLLSAEEERVASLMATEGLRAKLCVRELASPGQQIALNAATATAEKNTRCDAAPTSYGASSSGVSQRDAAAAGPGQQVSPPPKLEHLSSSSVPSTSQPNHIVFRRQCPIVNMTGPERAQDCGGGIDHINDSGALSEGNSREFLLAVTPVPSSPLDISSVPNSTGDLCLSKENDQLPLQVAAAKVIPRGIAYRAPQKLLTQLAPAIRQAFKRPSTSLTKQQPGYAVYSHSITTDNPSGLDVHVSSKFKDLGGSGWSSALPLRRSSSVVASSSIADRRQPIENMQEDDPFATLSPVHLQDPCRIPPPSAGGWARSAASAMRMYETMPLSTALALPVMPQRARTPSAKKKSALKIFQHI